MAPDTNQLVRDASRGDGDARAELLVRFLPALQLFLRVRMGPALRSKETAEDLAQSVCREVLMDLGRFEDRGEAAFRQWLFLSAARKLKDRVVHFTREKRDARREEPLIELTSEDAHSLLTPSRVAIGREDLRRLTEALDGLSDDQRQVVAHARLLGMKLADIARDMDKTEGQVRGLLYRGLARLGTALEP